MLAVNEEAMKPKAIELWLFRSGEWSVKHPWICYGNDEVGEELPSCWHTNIVFPVGDAVLGQLDAQFCDVLEESSRLQYMPLPMAPCFCGNMCITDGGTVKFVNILPHLPLLQLRWRRSLLLQPFSPRLYHQHMNSKDGWRHRVGHGWHGRLQ